MTIRVVVVGACGRMGSEVARLVAVQPDMRVVAAVEAPGHPQVGASICGAVVVDELQPALENCDAVVDFSAQGVVAANATSAAAAGRPYVCGVTGLSDVAMESLRDAAKSVPVVYSANFSVGVAVLARLTTEAARLLGEAFDAEIIEVHHRTKRDAPSGTARLLARSIQESRRGVEVVCSREGLTGVKPVDKVGISSVRTGDVVGEHTVLFGGLGERLELVHRVQSRTAFATGVVMSIRFTQGSPPGMFAFADALRLGK